MLTIDQWLAFSGLILGVVGVVAGYIFYVRSKKERAPWYSVHPLRVHIVDTAQTDIRGLEIRHDGIVISDQNITCTTVFFGNRGSAPILSSDILEPLIIRLPEESEILTSRIVKVSRTVCGFSSSQSPREMSVAFTIAEQYDGAKVQIIHTGDPDAKISVIGTFVGCELSERDHSTIGQVAWRSKLHTGIDVLPPLTALISSWFLISRGFDYIVAHKLPAWTLLALMLTPSLLMAILMAFTNFSLTRMFDRLVPNSREFELLQQEKSAKVKNPVEA